MLYKKRQIIEHVFAHLKSHLSLERCQTGYTKQPVLVEEKKTAPQKKHIALVIMAFVILEKEACEKNTTFREIKQRLIFRRGPVSTLENISSRADA